MVRQVSHLHSELRNQSRIHGIEEKAGNLERKQRDQRIERLENLIRIMVKVLPPGAFPEHVEDIIEFEVPNATKSKIKDRNYHDNDIPARSRRRLQVRPSKDICSDQSRRSSAMTLPRDRMAEAPSSELLADQVLSRQSIPCHDDTIMGNTSMRNDQEVERMDEPPFRTSTVDPNQNVRAHLPIAESEEIDWNITQWDQGEFDQWFQHFQGQDP